jgi:hypothetical protein
MMQINLFKKEVKCNNTPFRLGATLPAFGLNKLFATTIAVLAMSTSLIAQTTTTNLTIGATPYAVPSQAKKIYVQVWGAGGGGGSATQLLQNSEGSGGGAGGYSASLITVTPPQNIAYLIGTGGSGGNGGTASLPGGNSNFNTTVIANGGAGGSNCVPFVCPGTPGTGGTASGGTPSTTGGSGVAGNGPAPTVTTGKGGDSPNGGTGGAGLIAVGNGNPGNAPGGGGGGGYKIAGGTDANGGNGANGRISVEYIDCAGLGGSASLAANSVGNIYDFTGMTTYAWSISGNGTIVGGTTNPTLSVTAGAPGSYTVNVTVTNANGAESQCSKVVTITDLTPPVITCPLAAPFTKNTNASCQYTAVGTEFDATATDNVAVTGLTYNLTGVTTGTGSSLSGVNFEKGLTTVTWTASDAASNTSTCSFNVTVNDNEVPTVSAATNVTANTSDDGTGNCDVSVAITDATFGDNCTGSTLAWVFSGATTGSGSGQVGTQTFNRGLTTITYTVTDAVSLTATSTMTVTVTDDENPTVSADGDVTANTSDDDTGDCDVEIAINDATFGDNCTGSTLAWAFSGATTGSGSGQVVAATFNKGVTTITYTVTDAASLTATATMTVTVTDDESPTVTCPPNRNRNTDPGLCTFTAGAAGTPFNPSSSSDNCPDLLTFTNNLNGGSSLGGYTFSKGLTTVIWEVADAAGNTGTCSYTVSVTDNENPTVSAATNVTANTSDDGTGNCDVSVAITDATFGDNCTGSTLSWAFSGVTSGSGNGQVGTQTFNRGLTTITYTVTDAVSLTATATMTVTVTDNEVPAFTPEANKVRNTDPGVCTFTVPNNGFNPAFSDNCAGSTRTNNFNNTNTLNGAVFPLGVTTVIWTATDASLNTSTTSYTVTVNDNQAPTLSNPGAQTLSTGAGICTRNYTIASPVSDNCTGATWGYSATGATTLSASGIASGTGSGPLTFNRGVTTIVLSATDGTNLATTSTFTVTVNDNQAPLFTPELDKVRVTDPGVCTFTVPGNGFNPAFSDNCTGATRTNNFNNTNTLNGAVFPLGVTTVIWTATDASLNTSTTSYTVTVNDNQAPVFTPEANKVRNTDPGVCSFTLVGNGFNPAFSDNCTGATRTNNFNNTNTLNGAVFPQGVTTVIWTATDASLNTSTTSYTVTVNDNQVPVLSNPGDQMINVTLGLCTGTYTIADPVTDNCSDSTTWSYSTIGATSLSASGIADGTGSGVLTFNKGETVVLLNATDGTNSATLATFKITIIDNEVPTVSAAANVTANTSDDVSGNCSTLAAVPDATFGDNCTGASLAWVFSGASSGSGSGQVGTRLFNKGVTTITYTATDAVSLTATATMTVTVTDNEVPTITCPPNRTRNTDTLLCSFQAGVAGTPFNFTATSDNCPGPYTITNDFNGLASLGSAIFPKGVTTVVWQIADSSGNTGTCSYTVTVNDNEVPTFTAPSDITLYTDASCSVDTTVTSTGDVTDEDDNCPIAINATYSDVSVAGSCQGTYVITRTWSLLDSAGNAAADQIQTITVSDTTSPTFTRPADVTIYTDGSCGFDSTTAATGDVTDEADNCSTGIEATYSDATVAGSCQGTYIITRTWSLVDNCSNAAADQVQTITVSDTTRPTFTVPSDITLYTDASCFVDTTVSSTGDVTDEADNCSTGIEATYSDVVTPICQGSYTIERTWSLVDNCSNAAFDQLQTITVSDTTRPTFSVPSDITLYTDASCFVDTTVSSTGDVTDEADNCSTGIEATYSDVVTPICQGSYTIERTWSLVDNCSNAAFDQLQTITVSDTTRPTFTVPSDIALYTDASCFVDTTVSSTGDVTDEDDNCSTGIEATYSDVVTPVCQGSYTITRTWSLVDNCSNAAFDQVQTITVSDTTRPTFTVPSDITLYKNASCFVDTTVSSTGDVTDEDDNCSTGIEATYSDVVTPICQGSYTIERTWSLIDNCSNAAFDQVQTITVSDTTRPVVVCPANISVSNDQGECGAIVTFAASATDNCSTPNIVYSQNPGTFFVVGTTTVLVTATDDCGNSSTCEFDVTVTDDENPIISCLAPIIQSNDSGACGAIVLYTAPEGTDNCLGATTVQIAGLPSGSFFPLGVTTNVFEVTDVHGNSTTCSFDVTIEDNELPTLIAPGNITLYLDSGCGIPAFVLGTPVINDNCSSSPLVLTNDAPTVFGIGTTLVTWKVKDDSGNTATSTQTVTVLDTIAPVAVNCPTDINTCDASSINFILPTATDNCGPVTVTQISGPTPGSIFPLGTSTLVYELRDNSNNTSTCSFNVTVAAPVDGSFTVAGKVLTANNVLPGVTYQWYSCNPDTTVTLIAGATNRTFTATQTGSYTLVTRLSGCSATAGCVAVVVIGVENVSLEKASISIYPNPATSDVMIELNRDATLEIYASNGQLVEVSKLDKGTHTKSIADFAQGTYMVKFIMNDTTVVQRLVIYR